MAYDSNGTFDSPAIDAEMRPMDESNQQQIDAAVQNRKTTDMPADELSVWLNGISDDIERSDRDKRLQHARKQIKAHQYLDGNFYGYVDNNLEWRERDRAADEVWYVDNQIYPYLRSALMELARTQTQVVVSPPPGASARLEAAAKFAQARVDTNRGRTYIARLSQTRNAYALLNGIVWVYTYMDFGCGRPEKTPILQKRETKGGDTVRLCANCYRVVPDPVDLDMGGDDEDSETPATQKAEGAGDDESKEPKPKCLHCGSTEYDEIDVGGESDTVIGYDEKNTGHNQWTCPNPVAVIVYMQASCVAETPYIKWKQPILRAVLEDQFPDYKIPGGGIESIELRYITDQTKAVPVGYGEGGLRASLMDGGSGGKELEPLEYQRHWLDYALYCNKTFKEDIDLGDGKTLKAGQKLGTMFKKGLYFSRVGTLILEIWDEDKNRKWTSSPYGLRPGSMYGTGSSIALSDQETLNDLETLKMANAWSNAVPREFVDPAYISELSADPSVPTTLKTSVVDGNIEGKAYHQAPAAPLSQEVYALSERRESALQNHIGALSGTGEGGLADTQAWGNTATALSIKRDLAVGRFAPDLELMADQIDREQAIQFCENEQEYYTEQQWKTIVGDYGQYGLQSFLKCDLRNDLLWTIAPGSFMPRSDAQQQAKFMAYAQLLPVLAQIQNPEVAAYAAEVFGMPEFLAGWATDRAAVARLITRFKALTQLFIGEFGDLPDPNIDDPASPAALIGKKINDYSQIPVDTFLDDHSAMIDALRDWRETDEGQNAPNVLLAAVAMRILLHQTAKTKQAQMGTRMAMAANQPAVDQQNQDVAAAQEAAQQSADQDKQDQAQQQGLTKIADLADAEANRNHQRQMQMDKFQHEKDMAPPPSIPGANMNQGAAASAPDQGSSAPPMTQ